jgi:hypothetical protein
VKVIAISDSPITLITKFDELRGREAYPTHLDEKRVQANKHMEN